MLKDIYSPLEIDEQWDQRAPHLQATAAPETATMVETPAPATGSDAEMQSQDTTPIQGEVAVDATGDQPASATVDTMGTTPAPENPEDHPNSAAADGLAVTPTATAAETNEATTSSNDSDVLQAPSFADTNGESTVSPLVTEGNTTSPEVTDTTKDDEAIAGMGSTEKTDTMSSDTTAEPAESIDNTPAMIVPDTPASEAADASTEDTPSADDTPIMPVQTFTPTESRADAVVDEKVEKVDHAQPDIADNEKKDDTVETKEDPTAEPIVSEKPAEDQPEPAPETAAVTPSDSVVDSARQSIERVRAAEAKRLKDELDRLNNVKKDLEAKREEADQGVTATQAQIDQVEATMRDLESIGQTVGATNNDQFTVAA